MPSKIFVARRVRSIMKPSCFVLLESSSEVSSISSLEFGEGVLDRSQRYLGKR